MKRIAVVLALLSLSPGVWADSPWIGTWVQRNTGQGVRLTMTVEEVGSGLKFTYKFAGPDAPPGINIISIQSQLERQGCSGIGRRQADGPTDGDPKGR